MANKYSIVSKAGEELAVIEADNQYHALSQYVAPERIYSFYSLPSYCTQSNHRKPTVSFKDTWLQATIKKD